MKLFIFAGATIIEGTVLLGCGGNVTVESSQGGAGGSSTTDTGGTGGTGGATTVPCDDSLKWKDPPFTQEVSAGNADMMGLTFANACLDHDKIAAKNNMICEGQIPLQVPWVYCVSLDNVDHFDLSCVNVEVDGGSAFSTWAKGLQKTLLCSIFFTQAP